ncbi:M20/M25/M40 family metallo-hydrolase [Maritalea sp.]|uniref:M20/M25/M40 family metallo-hydrolase n=1 Tax=Maritalea sp. TaxID=2003361 RepID=UPI003EF3C2F2
MTHDDIVAAQTLRHKLHASPELSGEEVQTAKLILEQLKPTNPDWTMSNIGGHGVVAAYDSGKPGLNLLFRAELDALPIQETTQHPYKSKIDGKGHLCGHDGHTSILYLLGVRHQMKWVI